MRRFALLLLLLLPSISFAQGRERVPEQHWMQFADPAEAGFDAEKLEAARLTWKSLSSSAFLVVADGAVVASWGDVERRFMCHSVRKSFLSALYGIYWDRGEIDLNQNMADLGIDDEPEALLETEKRARILDLLKARSGVFHPAAYAGRTDSSGRGSQGPGRYFAYNNWDFNTLAAILEQKTGEGVFDAFDQYFAGPLGMEDWRVSDGYYHYEKDKSKYPAYPFRMSARDAARFGLLFTRDGKWGSESLLSRHWVRRSSSLYSIDDEVFGYGFMWWVSREPRFERHGMFAALGVGNQMIAALPDSDLVIVNRANTYDGEHTSSEALRDLIGEVLDARTGKVAPSPRLLPMASAEAPPETTESASLDTETYVGKWSVPPASFGQPARYEIEIRGDEDGLWVDSPRSGVFRLYLQEDGTFFEEDSQRRYYKAADEKGAFIGLASGRMITRSAVAAAARGETIKAQEILALAVPDDSVEFSVAQGIVELIGGREEAALERFESLAQSEETPDVEARINGHGYTLMGAEYLPLALRVFEINTEIFPEAFNTWDSLGEARMVSGDRAGAKEAYRRSLELNEDNRNAVAMLESMAKEPLEGGDDEAVSLMAKARVPGLTRAFIRDGEIARVEYLGVSDAETEEGFGEEILFEAASLSKPVFATLVLRMAERGEFDLDRPLHEWLENERMAHDDRSRALTARIVLSHRTGLPNWGGDQLEFSSYPGTAFGYSGEGFVYLQQVLEHLTDSTLDELARREIFDPLGMKHSRFSWTPEETPDLARPHDEAGTPGQKNPAHEGNAAASLHTTASEYARFVSAWMNGELLSPEWSQKALIPAVGVPRLGLDLEKPPEVTKRLAWGLGWGLQLPESGEGGGPVVWHWGDNGDFKAFVAFRSESGDGVVFFANASNGLAIGEDLVSGAVGDMSATFRWLDYESHDQPGFVERLIAAEAVAAGRLAEAIDAYRAALAVDPDHGQTARRLEWAESLSKAMENPVEVEEEALIRYAGSYGPRKLEFRDGGLFYQREGRDPFRLLPITETLFALEGLTTFRLEVQLDGQGRPVQLVGHYIQGFQDQSPRTESPEE